MDDQNSRSQSFARAAHTADHATRVVSSVTVYGRGRTRASRTSWVFLLIVVASGVISLLLRNYLTHPGLHVAGSTLLLDVVGIRPLRSTYLRARRTLSSPIVASIAIMLLLNGMGLLAIVLANDDAFAMTISAVQGVIALLLLLVAARA